MTFNSFATEGQHSKTVSSVLGSNKHAKIKLATSVEILSSKLEKADCITK